MNVYDFDGTIYKGDSTIDFYIFCVVRRPYLLVYLPRQLSAMLRYKAGRCSKTQMKENFYSFLRGLKDVRSDVACFWNQYKRKIDSWYMIKKQSSDLIISASPEFLLLPICRELGITHLIASKVECESGRYTGINCYGEEKVQRFQDQFENAVIDEFYSDSQSDLPMARLAKKAFLKKKGKFEVWET